jgi:hypothetical protein
MSTKSYLFTLSLLAGMLTCCTPAPTPATAAPEEEAQPATLINTSHLDHLFTETTLGDQQVGVIWIYCEAPDYHLVGDEDEGFTCVDDVARALVFYCRYYQQYHTEAVLDRIQSLTAFILGMQAENGYFYNFLLPDGTINTTHKNSVATPNWWSWRAFWALTELQLVDAPALAAVQARSQRVVQGMVGRIAEICPEPNVRQNVAGFEFPACLTDMGTDQAAIILMGLGNHFQKAPSPELRELLTKWGNLILTMQVGDANHAPYSAFLSWQNYWHAWGNSQAYALLYAGRLLDNEAFTTSGLHEVQRFQPYYLSQGGLHAFQATKEGDSIRLTDVQQFPQIAYNIRPLVYAALEAYRLTGDPAYATQAGELAAWLLGKNPAARQMYDPASGRTLDGLNTIDQVNLNSGAESTIEGLLTLLAVARVPAVQLVLEQYQKK